MSTDARFQVLQGKGMGAARSSTTRSASSSRPTSSSAGTTAIGPQRGNRRGELAAVRLPARVRADRPDDLATDTGGRGHEVPRGIRELGLDGSGEFDVVEANISDCLGCGYCNIGCPFGRKLSALDYALPKAADFGDAVRIYSECGAHRVSPRNGGSAEVECRLGDGGPGERQHRRRLRRGIASSVVLQRARTSVGRTSAATSHGTWARRSRPSTTRSSTRTPAFRSRTTSGRRATTAWCWRPGSTRGAVAVHAGLVPGPFRQHAQLRPMASTGSASAPAPAPRSASTGGGG